MKLRITALMCIGLVIASAAAAENEFKTIGLDNIQIQGDLQKRLLRNFDRLETERFQPIVDDGCFRDPKYSWPGDMEGRTVLSLAMLQQTVDRDAKYLQKTLDMFPGRMNEEGYFGKNYFPQCDEQQLSGHGWLLRGLCELYLDRQDPEVKKMIEDVVNNLVVPTRGKHKLYPIDPAKREKEEGGYSGEVIGEEGIWRLSTDIGCDFIFMDGVIQAAEVLGREDLYPIIDEMIARFLEVDLVAIKAQTHATLTGLRGLIRYAGMTGKDELIKEAEKRFDLYVREGSTENHMNYNWFGRPTHTEPCAFIDAFMVASQLWQVTGKTSYLEEAHKIYFNGMGHAQRKNGGFGLADCLGSKEAFLRISCDEAWWCCTMRGSEGLTRAAEYSFMQAGNTLLMPFFNDAAVSFNGGVLDVQTEYPYNGKVTVQIKKKPKKGTAIAFFNPSWAGKTTVTLNGEVQPCESKDGFVTITTSLKKGDALVYTFDQQPYTAPTHNIHSIKGYQKIYQGPLLLSVMAKNSKEQTLPKKLKLRWNEEEHYAQVKGTDLKLYPINDVIDHDYDKNKDKYSRQVLWKK